MFQIFADPTNKLLNSKMDEKELSLLAEYARNETYTPHESYVMARDLIIKFIYEPMELLKGLPKTPPVPDKQRDAVGIEGSIWYVKTQKKKAIEEALPSLAVLSTREADIVKTSKNLAHDFVITEKTSQQVNADKNAPLGSCGAASENMINAWNGHLYKGLLCETIYELTRNTLPGRRYNKKKSLLDNVLRAEEVCVPQSKKEQTPFKALAARIREQAVLV